jgi:hypothetical protein
MTIGRGRTWRRYVLCVFSLPTFVQWTLFHHQLFAIHITFNAAFSSRLDSSQAGAHADEAAGRQAALRSTIAALEQQVCGPANYSLYPFAFYTPFNTHSLAA